MDKITAAPLLNTLTPLLSPTPDVLTSSGDRLDHYLKTVHFPNAKTLWDKLTKLGWSAGYTIMRAPAIPMHDGAEDPMAVTDHKHHSITITSAVSDSAAVYLMLHELGHALGHWSHVDLHPAEAYALAMGAPRRVIPTIVKGEAEAELICSLVLQALGLPMDLDYFVNWQVTASTLHEVSPAATKAAQRIYKELA